MWNPLQKKRTWRGLAALVLVVGLVGGVALRPRPAEAVLIGLLLPAVQAPIGVAQLDEILIGLLLPAVQLSNKRVPDAVPARIMLHNAATGELLATMDTTLKPDGASSFLKLAIGRQGEILVRGDGQVSITDGTSNTIFLGERLELSVSAFVGVKRNSTAMPIGSIQVADTETGKTQMWTGMTFIL
jgi:hypothetical protein